MVDAAAPSPSQKGARAEAAVLAALVRVGYPVLVPWGVHRYDLAYEGEDRRLVRVQVKSGYPREGCVVFNACSETGRVSQDYRADVDFFGVYCHARGEVYLVPVADCPLRRVYLRVDPVRAWRGDTTRWAKDYLLS